MASAEELGVGPASTSVGMDSLLETSTTKTREEPYAHWQSIQTKQRPLQGSSIQHDLTSAGGKRTGQNTIPASRAALLPPEIIRKILFRTDPETFASSVLVCRSWRDASNDPKLYLHQLSRSPCSTRSQSAISAQVDGEELCKLKKLFALEAKRNLFLPFLRPRITTFSLIAEAPLSSFAAGPGGEKFEFFFSLFARWCLAISSSRIYVVDLAGAEGLAVTKQLKVLRRPLAVDILPDGSVLAVLSSDHSVSLYSVQEESVQLKRSVELDNVPYAIAMSPGGEILAAAFDGGLELCSLREDASRSEKRSVKTHRVDKLMFSSDGAMLLGTTQSRDPATVILTAPYFSAAEYDLTPSELVNSMWTQQILFPSSSRDCSHSTLLPRNTDQDSNWTLTYDRTYESFRAVRTDDLRNGTTYFTGPENGSDRRIVWPKDALTPLTLPSATARGDLVAAGFNRSEIWLYGVPETLDAGPVLDAPSAQADGEGNAAQNGDGSNLNRMADNEGPPRWQMLVDRYRNVFSKGVKVAEVSGVSSMCWFKADNAADSAEKVSERLVLAAPGGVGSDYSLDEETPIDGGRVVVLEFGLFPGADERKEVTIELGTTEPQLLEEQKADMETEIARARRRTLAQRDAARVKSVLDALRPENSLEDVPEIPGMPRATASVDPIPTDDRAVSDDEEPGVTLEEAASFAEGPYSHTSPRSRTALYRSATVNQASRRREQQTRRQEEAPPPPMRRQDGTEVPDESDADNWVPPPPPYQRHADELLPDDLVQRALMYNGIAPLPSTAESMVRPRRSSSLNDSNSQRRRSSVDVDLLAHHLRPIRPQGDHLVGPGDTSAVSSASVTPRTSIRRRPLTVYQSSSSALRESTVSRSASQATRTPSLGSSRISRSESLRQTSRPASEVAPAVSTPVAALSHSRSHTPVQEHQDWPLPVPHEEVENMSLPDETSPPSGQGHEMQSDPQLSPVSNPADPQMNYPEPALDIETLPEPVIAPIGVQGIQGEPVAEIAQMQTRHHEETVQQDLALPEVRGTVANRPPETVAVDVLNYTMPATETSLRDSQPNDVASPVAPYHEPIQAVPEPSAYQISALQNRPRPQVRRLSGSSGRGRGTPSPILVSRPAAVELPETTSQPKEERPKPARSLSRRLRGAMRRNETEPAPELPQVPQLVTSGEPTPTGPARHSRLYADQRNNVSEPALRARPQARRLETIQSVRNEQMPPSSVGPKQEPVRPQHKRSRSIFSRRKSRGGGTGPLIPLDQGVPPVPAIAPMASSASQAGPDHPVPGMLRRAVTEYQHNTVREETAYTESSGHGKARKGKDRDAKCTVM